MIIVSACLAGLACRYDGKSKINSKIIELIKTGKAIPVCPE
ncbi:MAG: 2-thiouracil desulfurase family protein, partial [Patescibacteria group bacterium]